MHVYLLEGKRLCEKHKREENSHSFSTCGSLKIKKECLFLNRHTKSKVWGDYRNGEPSAHDEQKIILY